MGTGEGEPALGRGPTPAHGPLWDSFQAVLWLGLEGVIGFPGSCGLDLEGVMAREPSWPASWQRHPSHSWHGASAWAALKGAQWAWLLLLPETSGYPSALEL